MIILMIIAILVVLGLCFGSFVNALVWRVYQQSLPVSKRPKKTDLSITKGRSVCVHCHHQLSARDLLPIISWVSLKGRCRYCHKPISWQYPAVELSTAVLFVISYVFWPQSIKGLDIAVFGLWLALIVSFMALIVYDIRWMLLPNKIMVYTLYLAVLFTVFNVIARGDFVLIAQALAGALVGGGLFMVIFYLSDGKWIGGGDVKLGFLLGLIAGSGVLACLMLFVASLFGTIFAVPAIAFGSKTIKAKIPFGPFLIMGCYVAVLFGVKITDMYLNYIGY